MTIAPLLYQQATAQEKQILQTQYDVREFKIMTIKQERIFADKILAAEFYYERGQFFDISKHLFDLCIMLQTERIQSLISCPQKMVAMLAYKRQEEQYRIGSDLSKKPFSEFQIFSAISENDELAESFYRMQKIYVFDENDVISYEELETSMAELNKILLDLDEELAFNPHEQGPTFDFTMGSI